MKKVLVRLASFLFPWAVVSFAYRQLTNPKVRKLRAHEMEVLNRAEKHTQPFREFTIQRYTWKGGPETVLLIHGWEGQAGNFADLVDELLTHGFTVESFDAPAHGFSSVGKTTMFDFTDLATEMIRKTGAKKLVSHSFGAVVTTYALYKNPAIRIDRYAMITTPDTFNERIDDVVRETGITANVRKRLVHRLEKEAGEDISVLNVSRFVQHINVGNGLIIHDRDDRVLPVSRSKNVHRNWAASEFIEITGTGHYRILRTKSVLDKIVAFLES